MVTSCKTAMPLPAMKTFATRALFPKVMEFKVICRESEKHEFMPVVYLIERSAAWKLRVPRVVEEQLVQDYIAPLVPLDNQQRDQDATGTTGFSADELGVIGTELQKRTELLKLGSTRELSYKMGVLLSYAAVPTLQKSQLFQVVRKLLLTLGDATHKRALLVPVSMHFCTDGDLFNSRRYAGIRYGSPVLVDKRDVEIFQEDPLEFVHHVTAKLSASLKMPPPQTAAQMELLRLSRSLHVYCAKVYRDDCFSRRQIASMNEEILQIHFRTRNHPDMLALKATMQEYFKKLRRWRLRDEDINTAAVAAASPRTPRQVASVVTAIFKKLVVTPWNLLLSGLGDVIYLKKDRTLVQAKVAAVGVVKYILALLLSLVALHAARITGHHWLVVGFVLAVLVTHSLAASAGGDDVAAHWKKPQFHLMDAAELRELKEMRAVLARRIHAIVAQYVSADLPPPVLQSPSTSRTLTSPRDDHSFEDRDDPTYSLNLHHKIFINAPRSFPLDFAANAEENGTARRAVYAPKMLRDEVWRNIYGSLAPPQLQFSALLADNKGDSLPMDRLLSTPFFNAVLTAYMLHHKSSSRSGSDLSATDVDSSSLDDMIAASEPPTSKLTHRESLGPYASVRAIVETALELAQEEEELSS